VKALKQAVVVLLLAATTLLVGGAASATEPVTSVVPRPQMATDAWCVQIFMGRIAQPVFCVPVLI
jgi:hypothetical protein